MYLWRKSLLWTALLLTFSSLNASQSINRRDDSDLCFMWYHSVAIVDDILYIANGEYTFEGQPSASALSTMLAVELSSNLAFEASIPYSKLLGNPFPSSVDGITNTQGTLWASRDKIYLWKINTSADTLQVFDIATKQWSSTSVTGNVEGLNGPGLASVSVPDQSVSFALGRNLPGFVIFNESDPNALTWTNQTSPGLSGTSVPAVYEDSELIYVPLGESGILLMFGSYYLAGAARLFDDISIYDIKSASWYTTTATAANPDDGIPITRGAFCSVVSSSPDRSSFQVTIYGGWDPAAGRDYEDVWVLTVPSFRWVRVEAINDFEYTPDLGRAHHRCAIYKERQMIVVGGSTRNGTQTQVNETMCRSQYPPLRLLDTSTYTWKKTLDPSANYTVPQIISDVIGGGADGGANLTEPVGGWIFTDLQRIMALNITQSNTTSQNSTQTNGSSSTTSSTSASGAPTSENSAAPTSKKSSTPAGAIAGGVVGGVVVLALIIGMAIYFRRRSRKVQKSSTTEEPIWLNKELPANDVQIHQADSTQKFEMDGSHRAELAASPAVHELSAPTGNRATEERK